MGVVIPNKRLSNFVGYTADNLCTTISIPIDKVQAEFGTEGAWTIFIQRNGDETAYQLPPERHSVEFANLIFALSNYDVCKAGPGQMQIRYSVDNVVKNSQIFNFYTEPGIEGDN